MTQGQVADAVGIKQSTYSNLEKTPGKRSIYIVEIALALGVEPKWLATGRGPVHRVASNDGLHQRIAGLVDEIGAERVLKILNALAGTPEENQ